jgi:hypothetical protein
MPPAAEPLSERVVQAVVAALAGITAGATYWHDTEKAIADPQFHGGHMDKSLAAAKASFVVCPDQDEDLSDSFTDYATRIELDVVAFKKFEPPAERLPWNAQTAPKRGTVQRRLAADVKNALRSVEGLPSVTTGGSTRVWIPFTHLADDQTLFQGWAVVMLRVVIETTHGPGGA